MAGEWLRRRPVPLPEPRRAVPGRVAVVVPARDEARRLPLLLASLDVLGRPGWDVVVVDDGSRDATAALAHAAGARVVTPGTRPAGWTGKAWACATGVAATDAGVVVLLDADVVLAPGALERVVAVREERGGLVSCQPQHRPVRAYEHLSALPDVVAWAGVGPGGRAAGAGTATAFGPCIVVRRDDYDAVGGHGHPGVRGRVADDVALAQAFAAAGHAVHSFAGGPWIGVRSYPDGPGQLVEGWTKNLATGASSVGVARTAAVGAWVGALAVAPLLVSSRGSRVRGLVVWAVGAWQLRDALARVGRYAPWAWAAPAVPVGVFTALTVRSAWRRATGRPVRWRGRDLTA